MVFEQDFEAMLKQYSDALDDKKRFTGLVKDCFPDQAKNINLLLMAYNLGIAQDMQNISLINNTFAYRYVKQLMDDFGLSRANADWIVSVWCVCYGQKVLNKSCDIRLQEKGTGPSVKEETSGGTQKYGDLFQYRKSSEGSGLAVCGFNGENKRTIIFQNKSGGQSIIEIGENTFAGESVEGAILTDGIKYIGKRAFANCSKLNQVVMPLTVIEIGDEAYANCENLKSISLPMQLEKLGARALSGTSIKSVVFPQTLYWIGEEALAQCKELDNISMPTNIDRLPNGMFDGCTKLKKVSLHDNVTEIGDRAFAGCSNLDILTIPDSVVKIGENAFDGTDEQFIIQCSFGSCAEEYARNNKIKYQLA